MIRRGFNVLEAVVFGTTVGACTDIPFAEFAGGEIYLPAGTAVTLTFYGAPRQKGWTKDDNTTQGDLASGDFTPLYDDAGAALVRTVVNTRAYPFPKETFGVGTLRITSNVAQTAVVTLKG